MVSDGGAKRELRKPCYVAPGEGHGHPFEYGRGGPAVQAVALRDVGGTSSFPLGGCLRFRGGAEKAFGISTTIVTKITKAEPLDSAHDYYAWAILDHRVMSLSPLILHDGSFVRLSLSGKVAESQRWG